jgi:hypothetical protein
MLELLQTIKAAAIQISVDQNELVLIPPKNGIAPELIKEIKLYKLELIEFLGRTVKSHPQIPKAKVKDSYLPSPTQYRYWKDYMNGHGDTFGNLFYQTEFAAGFDLGCLTIATNLFVAHHELFRTVFKVEGESLSLVIRPEYEVVIPLVELSESTDVGVRMQEEIDLEKQKPFSIEKEPLMRIKVLKVESDRYIVMIVSHHLILDGIGFDLMLKKITEYYRAVIFGQHHELVEPKFQYKDFCEWSQSQYATTANIQRQRQFWQRNLSDIERFDFLPMDYSKQDEYDFEGRNYQFTLSPQQEGKMLEFVAEERTTPFNFFLTLQFLTFIQMTGNNDMIVGTPVAGRDNPELECSIGYHANLILIRGLYREGMSFADLLKVVKNAHTNAVDNQDYQINNIIEDLNIPRTLCALPITTTYIVQVEQPITVSGIENHVFTDFAWNQRSDLTLCVTKFSNLWQLEFRYRKCMFTDSEMRYIADRYYSILNNVLELETEELVIS